MTVPEKYAKPKPSRRQEYTHGRSNVKATWTCCIQADDDEPRPKPRPHLRTDGGYTSPVPMQLPTSRPSSDIRRKPVPSSQKATMSPSEQRDSPSLSSTTQSNSQTQSLLSLIPRDLSPQTTSLLLSELGKPISPSDEAGYIYIFWLTPDSSDKPDDETATSIIDDSDSDDEDPTKPSSARRPEPRQHSLHQRRQSEALKRYASVRAAPTEPTKDKRTITLKIGRAANVHRRMSQWTKQCGQDITLVRYYPHRALSAGSSHGAIRCPHIHRVERLVHLELADQRVTSEPCAACGREHKEWFEINASRKGLRKVDRAIKRWVKWAEEQDRQSALTDGTKTVPYPASAKLRPIDGYY
jgi:hypothetical protein